MSTINVTGILTGPIDGSIMSNSSIKITALENYDPVTLGASSVYEVGTQGVYNFDLYYGTYAVYILSSRSWRYLGEVAVTDQLPASIDMVVLLG